MGVCSKLDSVSRDLFPVRKAFRRSGLVTKELAHRIGLKLLLLTVSILPGI